MNKFETEKETVPVPQETEKSQSSPPREEKKSQGTSPSSGSVLDMMKKQFSTEEVQPRTAAPPAPVKPVPVIPAPIPARPRQQPQQIKAGREVRVLKSAKRGPLPLWLTQLLMLGIFGGVVYCIIFLYEATNKFLGGAYSTVDQFLLGLQFKYDRTEKK